MQNFKTFNVPECSPKKEEYYLEIFVRHRSEMAKNEKRFPSKNLFTVQEIKFETGTLANIPNKGWLKIKSGKISFSWEFQEDPDTILSLDECCIQLFSKTKKVYYEKIVMVTKQVIKEHTDASNNLIKTYVSLSNGEYEDFYGIKWNDSVDQIRICLSIAIQTPGSIVPVASGTTFYPG